MAQLEEGITQSYRDIFGRDPNQDEINFYVKEFGGDGIYDGDEEDDLEQRLYNSTSVGRQAIVDASRADTGGGESQNLIYSGYGSGMTEVATEDKKTPPPTLADTAGLQRLYQNILFREADPTGLAGFIDRPMEEVRQALRTSPEAMGPARIRQAFQEVLNRPARPEDMAFYGEKFGPVVSNQERANLVRAMRPEQLQRFETQLGIPAATPSGPIQPTPALDFSKFGTTPTTAGIDRLRPRDDAGNLISGTMASAFANPQFTAPDYSKFGAEMPNTFKTFSDLVSENIRQDAYRKGLEAAADVTGQQIVDPTQQAMIQELAETEGNLTPMKSGGLASLGYRRGGVVDENGIPRLFIGGLFKKVFKGVAKIAPFVLPFIPGFQALSLPMQSLIAGGVGGFRDGKFDLKRAVTSGLTTYGIGKLAQAAGTPVGTEGGGVQTAPAGSQNIADEVSLAVPGLQPDPVGGSSYFVPDAAGRAGVSAGEGIVATNSAAVNPAAVDPSLTGLDRLKAEAVGTGQRIGDTFSNIVSGDVEAKKLITPALTTVGGITATKAADEVAKQEAEYKALTAADAEEKKRKRNLALNAMRRNPFGYNEGGVSSLPARYLDGAGDGMSDSIRANIGGMQEARLADGEFVVPADVVADLGNGSSNAGAERLYSMMDRIRQVRHGTTKQPPEVDVNKTLPA